MRFALLSGPDHKPVLGARTGNGMFLDVAGALWAFRDVMGRDIVPLPLPTNPLEAAQIVHRLRDLLPAAVESLAHDDELQRFLLPADTRLLAPLPRPHRIFGIGRNYAEHARELGNAVPEDEPIVFLKASSSVIAPYDPIVLGNVGRVDFEGELLAVVGVGGKNIAEDNALKHIAGYTLFNDVTARDMQRAAQEKKRPWFMAKSLDTFGPMGPYLLTADEVPDPHNLQLTLTVNGETRQNGSTSDMIFSLPFLVSYLSRYFALEPGDVIATGTPSGVGPLNAGDTVAITIEPIGTLSNPVVASL